MSPDPPGMDSSFNADTVLLVGCSGASADRDARCVPAICSVPAIYSRHAIRVTPRCGGSVPRYGAPSSPGSTMPPPTAGKASISSGRPPSPAHARPDTRRPRGPNLFLQTSGIVVGHCGAEVPVERVAGAVTPGGPERVSPELAGRVAVGAGRFERRPAPVRLHRCEDPCGVLIGRVRPRCGAGLGRGGTAARPSTLPAPFPTLEAHRRKRNPQQRLRARREALRRRRHGLAA